jgi:carboxyl-terminal processing protease
VIDLNRDKRSTILNAIKSTVREKFYDPQLNGVDWDAEVEARRETITSAADMVAFEKSVNDLLKCLRTSHVGLIHDSVRRATAKMALSATFFKYGNGGDGRWMFQDVHEGGPAQLAGVKSGELLLRVDDQESRPPEAPAFPMGATSRLLVRSASGQERMIEIKVPDPRSKKNPVIVPKLVTAKRMDDGLGYLKVSMFPGILGIDVANEISAAVSELDRDRLVIDLRGNTGGGMGCLRLMSLLVPDRRPVGYSLTRKRAVTGFEREKLPTLDRIPSKKWGVLPLIIKFALGDKSIAVFTEELSQQRFHKRVVLLTNEHSASASEMVAAFAAETGSAYLAGEKTPGRVVGANSFKVGHGFRVALPVVAYHTWDGQILEGKGVYPMAPFSFEPESTRAGADEQLKSAVAFAKHI